MRWVSDLQFVGLFCTFVLPLPPKEQATDLQYELKCYFYWVLILFSLAIFYGSFKMIQFKILISVICSWRGN